MLTDQGIIQGKAHETLRYRSMLRSKVKIFADVAVKHATLLAETDLATIAEDTFYRGLADAMIVTGVGTGKQANLGHLQQVKDAVPQARVFVGSGVTADTIVGLLQYADGAIVGTCFKRDGMITNEVDENHVRDLIKARA